MTRRIQFFFTFFWQLLFPNSSNEFGSQVHLQFFFPFENFSSQYFDVMNCQLFPKPSQNVLCSCRNGRFRKCEKGTKKICKKFFDLFTQRVCTSSKNFTNQSILKIGHHFYHLTVLTLHSSWLIIPKKFDEEIRNGRSGKRSATRVEQSPLYTGYRETS